MGAVAEGGGRCWRNGDGRCRGRGTWLASVIRDCFNRGRSHARRFHPSLWTGSQRRPTGDDCVSCRRDNTARNTGCRMRADGRRDGRTRRPRADCPLRPASSTPPLTQAGMPVIPVQVFVPYHATNMHHNTPPPAPLLAAQYLRTHTLSRYPAVPAMPPPAAAPSASSSPYDCISRTTSPILSSSGRRPVSQCEREASSHTRVAEFAPPPPPAVPSERRGAVTSSRSSASQASAARSFNSAWIGGGVKG